MNTRLIPARSLLIGLIVLSCSCSNRTGTVTGKITYKKQSLSTGAIHFLGEAGISRSSPIGSDGTYTILECPPGAVKVCLESERPKNPPLPADVTNPDAVPQDVVLPGIEMISVIPRKYNLVESSGLSYVIKPGSQTIHIELAD